MSSTCPICPASARTAPRSSETLGLDLDVLAERAAQHRQELGHHLVEVDQRAGDRLAAAERQQLAGELGRAVGGLGDLQRVLARRLVLGQARQHQVHVAADDRQQVVEVVGHAAGEPADRLHLLRDCRSCDSSSSSLGETSRITPTTCVARPCVVPDALPSPKPSASTPIASTMAGRECSTPKLSARPSNLSPS